MSAGTQSELILPQPQPLDQNAAAVYIASLPAESGKRTQKQALRVIAGIFNAEPLTLNWGALRYQHTAAIRAKIAQAYKPATANKMLSALRQTLRRAWVLGQMTAEEYSRAIELEPVTGETLPAGRELSTGEILALITKCQVDPNTNAGTRDAAIIGLLYAAGLRRDEVVKLDVKNYDPDTGTLILTGQRNKERMAYITNGAAEALTDWLAIRGRNEGPLFVEVNKGGKVLIEREAMVVKPFRKIGGVEVANKKAGQTIYRGGAMTSQAIYNMLAKRAEEAGIKNFSPHDLRRTFISHLLDAGADITTVSKMAGHANIQTTARYDRRPEEVKKNTAKSLHVPYKTPKVGRHEE
ncbi:MAG TPA: tyrosine-type recombinase/integrase [Anaerolineales bacterium]|nr:tyrosine-type recombinase/integrase [Anaerolineales bacterium]